MPIVNGPLFSLDASGQLGKAIVYSKWKGRNYVRTYVTPTNPNSFPQRSGRAMVGFLSKQWATLTQQEQDSWNALAAASEVSAFNAYTQHNMDRWGLFEAPGKADPVTGGGTIGMVSGITVDGGVLSVTINSDLAATNDNWGSIVFASQTTGFTPAKSNAISVFVQAVTGNVATLITNLAAGTWFFRWFLFTDDGLISDSGEPEQSATVTAP